MIETAVATDDVTWSERSANALVNVPNMRY